jgi:alpha,alpha-trehalase
MNNGYETLRSFLLQQRNQVIRSGQGILCHDYLVPAGPYEEQWDWDGFFIGLALSRMDPTQAIFLKNWALNYIENADEQGKVPGCLSPQGIDPRLHQMKPFLAQGIELAASLLSDYSWIDTYWEQICSIVLYRERFFWKDAYGLAVWYDSMESGADNNIALLDYPKKTVLATDINTFLYLEYIALSRLATVLLKQTEQQRFLEKATRLKNQMQTHLWNEEDKIFYNRDTQTDTWISCISYASFVPLWAGIPSMQQGEQTILRYLLNPDHLWTSYGLRSLSKQDAHYNNINMIKPHSNWQGPIWVVANYMYIMGLMNYNFEDAARKAATNLLLTLQNDIQNHSGMHENYDAETGEPLAAPQFISWNLLALELLSLLDH